MEKENSYLSKSLVEAAAEESTVGLEKMDRLETQIKQLTRTLEQTSKELQIKNNALKISRVGITSQYARDIIEVSLDILIVVDLKGKILDVNKAMIDSTEKSRTQLLGSNFSSYFTDSVKAKKCYKSVFDNGAVVNYSLTIIDGALTDVLFNGSVLKDQKGKILGAVIVGRDISSQKRIEKELIASKINAEETLQQKQQFLSNMSHEIRTPMNAIIGFTKIVLKTPLTTKQKEFINAIKVSGDSLIVIIDDILDLAKVDSGKMVFVKEPFKLAAFITGIVHLFESRLKQKKIELAIDYNDNIPEILLGDSARLNQIILNILSNAEKFTSKGKIAIQVDILKQDAQNITLEFAISDTGIGIAANQLQAIFENFQQASTGTSRLYGGTGLGLAIAKQLVELQSGEISVESKLGEGSTFRIRMPFQKTKLKDVSETSQKVFHPKIKNISVLVVEDVALNQLLVKTILDDFKFKNDFAENGQIAIDKLEKKSYDIILMDLQMPIMNGFEATEIIRKKMKLEVPIIALTADVTTVDLGKCKALGMDDYIAKPIDEHVLLSKIVGLVNANHDKENEIRNHTMQKYVNLEYLNQRTKSNPKLMEEMISLYLEQTPKLVQEIKTSIKNEDWESLNKAVHKMIPSFSIMGMDPDFEKMAKKIQEFASTQEMLLEIQELVLQLENICTQACSELQAELITIKSKKE